MTQKSNFIQLKVISEENVVLRKSFSKKLHIRENNLTKQRQKPRWPTSRSMQAFLATVPHLHQVNGKTVPLGESQVINDEDWGYVLRCELQTHRRDLTFINIIHVPFNKREAKKKKKWKINCYQN